MKINKYLWKQMPCKDVLVVVLFYQYECPQWNYPTEQKIFNNFDRQECFLEKIWVVKVSLVKVSQFPVNPHKLRLLEVTGRLPVAISNNSSPNA